VLSLRLSAVTSAKGDGGQTVEVVRGAGTGDEALVAVADALDEEETGVIAARVSSGPGSTSESNAFTDGT